MQSERQLKQKINYLKRELKKRKQYPYRYLSKKDALTYIQNIKNPFLCEALITELEAQKAKLNPTFTSKTP